MSTATGSSAMGGKIGLGPGTTKPCVAVMEGGQPMIENAQRQATKDAGRIAGLDVRRIINEPTAAALAFGLDKSTTGERKIAVYHLGGEDFDQRIVDHVIAEFRQIGGVDLSRDPIAPPRIKSAAERAKIEPSSTRQTGINEPYIAMANNTPAHLNHVGAKDKATGKENQITIKANTGLTEAEIRKMARAAAAHAEDDRRVKELTASRNSAGAPLHATRKTMTEHGAKLAAPGRERIESAMAALEAALNGDDKGDIEAKAAALSAAAQKLGEHLYGQAANGGTDGAADGAADSSGRQAGGGERQGGAPPPDDLVDADFKEVRR